MSYQIRIFDHDLTNKWRSQTRVRLDEREVAACRSGDADPATDSTFHQASVITDRCLDAADVIRRCVQGNTSSAPGVTSLFNYKVSEAESQGSHEIPAGTIITQAHLVDEPASDGPRPLPRSLYVSMPDFGPVYANYRQYEVGAGVGMLGRYVGQVYRVTDGPQQRADEAVYRGTRKNSPIDVASRTWDIGPAPGPSSGGGL